MGAAQNECRDFAQEPVREVIIDNCLTDVVVEKALFDHGNQQWSGHRFYMQTGVVALNDFGIRPGFDSSLGSYYSNCLIVEVLAHILRHGIDYIKGWYLRPCRCCNFFSSDACGCITRHYNRLATLFNEKLCYPARVVSDGFRRLISIRQVRRVAEINELLTGQPLMNSVCNSETPYTRVKYANWSVGHGVEDSEMALYVSGHSNKKDAANRPRLQLGL